MTKKLAALLLFAAALAVLVIGEPDVDRRVAKASNELEATLASRDHHIDPAELLELMHNTLSQLVILDVRDEADYNLFHLAGARRLPAGDAGILWARGFPGTAVKVVVGNDEARANEAWKRLTATGTPNVYILDGGINAWLDLVGRFGQPAPGSEYAPAAAADGDDRMRYAFAAALGSRHAAALPARDHFAGREFQKKVTIVAPRAAPTGGCGG